MKILVVGNGGREHTLVWKLRQSSSVTNIFCAPGNAGTGLEATNIDIAATDIPRLIKFAIAEKIDLTVIGPEAPLVAGIVDEFQKAGLRVFGPSKKAAMLEGSKKFAKEIMKKANIPTAEFRAFRKADEAIRYIDEKENTDRFVIKADGLAAGKGVFVCLSKDEAREAIRRVLVHHEFGKAGSEVVIEEFLVGEDQLLKRLKNMNIFILLKHLKLQGYILPFLKSI